MTVKTQGGKVIAKGGKVSCGCCCPCEPPDGKFIISGASWTSIYSATPSDACGRFQATTFDGYTIVVSWSCDSQFWIGWVCGGEGQCPPEITPETPCELFSFFIFSNNPSGTHSVFDEGGFDPSCDDWTVTISEAPEEP